MLGRTGFETETRRFQLDCLLAVPVSVPRRLQNGAVCKRPPRPGAGGVGRGPERRSGQGREFFFNLSTSRIGEAVAMSTFTLQLTWATCSRLKIDVKVDAA